jgi:hypothetical protein
MLKPGVAVRVLMLTIAGMLGAVAPSFAQTSVKASSSSALAKAIATHDSAVSLYSQPTRARDAARLHMREVRYRDARDPEAVEALIMAANLLNYSNELWSARKTMEQAAERALNIGDVVTAAQAYTNATFIAAKGNNHSEVQRLGRKAVLLAESPLIDPQQRAAIRNRFQVNPRFAELLKEDI